MRKFVVFAGEPSFIKVVKSYTLLWVDHIARVEEIFTH